VILRLNGTEMLDWAEAWCMNCTHDHDYSHGRTGYENGCELILGYACQEEVPEWQDRGDAEHGYRYWLPAQVSCTKFEACAKCPPDDDTTERRNGETRREWAAKMRAETLSRPIQVGSDA
jgi:hypothetical protein